MPVSRADTIPCTCCIARGSCGDLNGPDPAARDCVSDWVNDNVRAQLPPLPAGVADDRVGCFLWPSGNTPMGSHNQECINKWVVESLVGLNPDAGNVGPVTVAEGCTYRAVRIVAHRHRRLAAGDSKPNLPRQVEISAEGMTRAGSMSWNTRCMPPTPSSSASMGSWSVQWWCSVPCGHAMEGFQPCRCSAKGPQSAGVPAVSGYVALGVCHWVCYWLSELATSGLFDAAAGRMHARTGEAWACVGIVGVCCFAGCQCVGVVLAVTAH